jgi:hypothetical protein
MSQTSTPAAETPRPVREQIVTTLAKWIPDESAFFTATERLDAYARGEIDRQRLVTLLAKHVSDDDAFYRILAQVDEYVPASVPAPTA